MTDQEPSLPRHLLLATDLSARCDRAQDRAVGLARAWNAKLTLVHAVDLRDLPSDHATRPSVAEVEARAFSYLLGEVKDIQDIDRSIEIRQGEPANVVLDVAREKKCDLIVAGISGNDALGRYLLGSTTSTLARKAETSLLVVKKRARSAYAGAIVASDLSDGSVRALQTGARLFGASGLTLFHAFDMPFQGFVDDRASYERGMSARAREDARAFIAGCLNDAADEVGVSVAFGDPAALLAEYAAKEASDLVIAGTRGRSGILGALLGSVAAAILDEVPCDVMIVPSKDARPPS